MESLLTTPLRPLMARRVRWWPAAADLPQVREPESISPFLDHIPPIYPCVWGRGGHITSRLSLSPSPALRGACAPHAGSELPQVFFFCITLAPGVE